MTNIPEICKVPIKTQNFPKKLVTDVLNDFIKTPAIDQESTESWKIIENSKFVDQEKRHLCFREAYSPDQSLLKMRQKYMRYSCTMYYVIWSEILPIFGEGKERYVTQRTPSPQLLLSVKPIFTVSMFNTRTLL